MIFSPVFSSRHRLYFHSTRLETKTYDIPFDRWPAVNTNLSFLSSVYAVIAVLSNIIDCDECWWGEYRQANSVLTGHHSAAGHGVVCYELKSPLATVVSGINTTVNSISLSEMGLL